MNRFSVQRFLPAIIHFPSIPRRQVPTSLPFLAPAIAIGPGVSRRWMFPRDLIEVSAVVFCHGVKVEKAHDLKKRAIERPLFRPFKRRLLAPLLVCRAEPRGNFRRCHPIRAHEGFFR